MAIEPQELKKLSSELKNQDLEVYQRAAARAGYYHAYHHCSIFADEHDLPLAPYEDAAGRPIHGVHEKLIQRFTTYRDSNQQKERCAHSIGIILNAMRTIRKEADYDLGKDFSREKTDDLLNHSDRLIQKCNEFINF